jgi:hypothetical protein
MSPYSTDVPLIVADHFTLAHDCAFARVSVLADTYTLRYQHVRN